MNRENTIVLFDVDGTLSKPRNAATPEMKQLLQLLRKKVSVGVVGGSDVSKIKEQLGETTVSDYDYVFSENGLVAFKDGKTFHTESIQQKLGDDKLKKLVQFILGYLSKIDIPIMRGTFIEYRTGMLNVSPIGRNCSQKEREDFFEYDKVHQVRAQMVDALQKQFPDYGLKYSIGGQISFDVFPIGWDKTYCLQFVKGFQTKYFFGDKTEKGGNDYEIYTSPEVIGTSVTSPDDTAQHLKKLFLKD